MHEAGPGGRKRHEWIEVVRRIRSGEETAVELIEDPLGCGACLDVVDLVRATDMNEGLRTGSADQF